MVQPWRPTQAARRLRDRRSAKSARFSTTLSLGRNFDELLRIVIALQTADAHNCATPADWRPGDDVIIPARGAAASPSASRALSSGDYKCLDWFLCFQARRKSADPSLGSGPSHYPLRRRRPILSGGGAAG